jgi:hypothetical protein
VHQTAARRKEARHSHNACPAIDGIWVASILQMEDRMPEKSTLRRARRDKRQHKPPTTQNGDFVREEVHHVREGKHGARSTKQAIAIGLSKARRAGVRVPSPPSGAKRKTRQSAAYARRAGAHGQRRPSPRRSHAMKRALKREPRTAASRKALARQARSASRRRRVTE